MYISSRFYSQSSANCTAIDLGSTLLSVLSRTFNLAITSFFPVRSSSAFTNFKKAKYAQSRSLSFPISSIRSVTVCWSSSQQLELYLTLLMERPLGYSLYTVNQSPEYRIVTVPLSIMGSASFCFLECMQGCGDRSSVGVSDRNRGYQTT
ncbi:hypothetical protein BJ508DRAFT_348823 [Ascobolus immersus RN42]|uniref:Uncharacterized protein n=1 Tax=Ascobolus immersus RN42 TaxID=1160509 RepID=A0A3N4I0M5_ASCIM|nr:hypothetical protein BJ508DRAFT_348823 [Ascobolus immersus RN42]